MKFLLALVVLFSAVSSMGQCVSNASQTCTPNINLYLPFHGSYQDDWEIPYNNNWSLLDQTLSGTGSAPLALKPVYNIDNTLFVDGVKYTNIAAAVTAAGSSQTVIIIPSGYAGSDCPAAASSKLTFLDYRGALNICTQNSISYGTTSGSGVYSLFRTINTAAGGVSVSGYFQSFLTNATGGVGTNADGGSLEVDVTGTLTGTFANVQAAENPVIVQSTGGTITSVVGQVGYVNTSLGSTTNITTVKGTWGLGCNVIAGSGPITNCYGTYSDEQTAGVTRNYALAGFGKNLLGYGGNFGGAALDAEDSSHTTHRFLLIDSASDTIVRAIGANGLFLQDNTGATQQLITTTGTALSGRLGLASTIVGSLPAAASNPGTVMYVTDSTAVASEGQTCVGGSTNKAMAFSNGSVWKCF